jgi:hypothetical protein
MDQKPIPLGVAAIGLFLAAGAGLPLANQLAREVPEGEVVSCHVTWSHLYYADIVLDTGRTVLLTSDDVAGLKNCIPAGSRLGKARGEIGFKLNGSYVQPATSTWTVMKALVVVGLGLCGFVLWQRRRNAGPRRAQ